MSTRPTRGFSIYRRLYACILTITLLVIIVVLGVNIASAMNFDREVTVIVASVIALVALCIIVWIAFVLLRSLREMLQTIQDVTQAVNSGSLGHRVPPLPAAEFDSLGTRLNRMLDSLEATVAEATLHRQRTSAIIDSANEGIVVVDSEGNVTDINPSAARMFETSSEEASHQPAARLTLFTPDEIGDLIERAHSGVVQPVVRRRGDRVLSAAVSTLRSDATDVPSGLVWVLRDVTDLTQIDEMKTEFISIVSHELRTPLTAIKGFTDLILEGEVGEISDQQREFLEIVQSNSDRLVSLINDMLDISRIESGRIALSIEEVDVTSAITQAVSGLLPLMTEKQLRVQNELEEPATVLADRARLQQILTNVLSNACKYTQPGGWITIRSESLEGQTAISISDTGIGIPADAMPHLFSKFFRVDQPQSPDAGGTGLGLPITRSLVEMHGGKIAIASRVDVGTTVRFTLPANGVAGAMDGDIALEGAAARDLVLVVSRDETERSAWEATIRAVPADVVVGRGFSAAATVGEAELHRPSVIVVRCGDGDGMADLDELLEELDASDELRDTPIIAVTGTSRAEYVQDTVTLLPGHAGPDEVAAVVRAVLPATQGRRPRRGRVLVAEDDSDMANWLRRLLVRNGFEVVIVRDGLAAIVRAVEILPDLIVLDANMPRMGASEVLPQLRHNPGTVDIPVVVISGTLPDAGQYFIEAGATDFFSKPINPDVLIRRLIQLDGQHRDR